MRPQRAPARPAALRTGSGILAEGLVVGITGAAVVALWFLLQDAAAGVPFRTPALLGAALFDGVRDPAMVQVTPRLVGAYTVVHVALYVAFGLALAGIFALADQQPRVLFGIFIFLCCLAVVFIGVAVLIALWLVDDLTPLAVVSGNVLAALAMGAVLFRAHRRVLRYARSAGE